MRRLAATLLLGSIFFLTTGGAPRLGQAQSYSALEEKQAGLDSRLLELQQERFRARQTHDDKRLKELDRELAEVQRRRGEVLQDLGQLR